jgi:site-specific recombinase XerD
MTDTAMSPLRRRMIDDMTIRRLGSKTQHDYIRHVKGFADFLGRSADKATPEDVRRYQLRLASIGTTVPTYNSVASALRFFFKVTLKRGDLAGEVQSAREPRRLPVVLSPEEVGRMLAATTNAKHKAALSLAYATGLRASEVVSLKISDIDSDRMVIRVEQGKGKKDRYVMLSSNLLGLLREWWRVARKTGRMFPGQPWLFPGYSGQPMSTRQLHRVVREAAARAGVTKRVGVHTLRHSFATHLLENKTDIRVIQVLLGHKKLDTTALYTRVAPKAIGEVTSPLDLLLTEVRPPPSRARSPA